MVIIVYHLRYQFKNVNLARTLYFCVSWGFRNKQQFFPLKGNTCFIFVTETRYTLCEVRTESLIYNSSDLSPCVYFLFPKLKLPLKGRLFEDVQDIQGDVTSPLRAIPQEDVQRSFQSLLDRATRCIDAEGMYFE